MAVLDILFIAWAEYTYFIKLNWDWFYSAVFLTTLLWPIFIISLLVGGSKWRYRVWERFSTSLGVLFFIFAILAVGFILPMVADISTYVFSLTRISLGGGAFSIIAARMAGLGFLSMTLQLFVITKIEHVLEDEFGEIDWLLDRYYE